MISKEEEEAYRERESAETLELIELAIRGVATTREIALRERFGRISTPGWSFEVGV